MIATNLENTAESALADVSNVNDVVARIFEFLQRRIDASTDTLIGRIVPQLLQVDRFFLLNC